MPSLKPSSITLFFAAKPSTIAKKRKLQVIEIDTDDEDPTEAVIVVDNAGTEQDNRLVDVTFVVDGDVLLVSSHVLAKPLEKAKVANRGFSEFGREAPEKKFWPGKFMAMRPFAGGK